MHLLFCDLQLLAKLSVIIFALRCANASNMRIPNLFLLFGCQLIHGSRQRRFNSSVNDPNVQLLIADALLLLQLLNVALDHHTCRQQGLHIHGTIGTTPAVESGCTV